MLACVRTHHVCKFGRHAQCLGRTVFLPRSSGQSLHLQSFLRYRQSSTALPNKWMYSEARNNRLLASVCNQAVAKRVRRRLSVSFKDVPLDTQLLWLDAGETTCVLSGPSHVTEIAVCVSRRGVGPWFGCPLHCRRVDGQHLPVPGNYGGS